MASSRWPSPSGMAAQSSPIGTQRAGCRAPTVPPRRRYRACGVSPARPGSDGRAPGCRRRPSSRCPAEGDEPVLGVVHRRVGGQIRLHQVMRPPMKVDGVEACPVQGLEQWHVPLLHMGEEAGAAPAWAEATATWMRPAPRAAVPRKALATARREPHHSPAAPRPRGCARCRRRRRLRRPPSKGRRSGWHARRRRRGRRR